MPETFPILFQQVLCGFSTNMVREEAGCSRLRCWPQMFPTASRQTTKPLT